MRVMYSGVSSQIGETLYRQGAIKFCCVGMCRAWNVLIGFGAGNGGATTSREVNFLVSRPQASDTPILEMVPVDFCPWCGEPVETCRVK